MSFFDWFFEPEPYLRPMHQGSFVVWTCPTCRMWYGSEASATECKESHGPRGTPPTNEDR